jgi:hypothetical protein
MAERVVAELRDRPVEKIHRDQHGENYNERRNAPSESPVQLRHLKFMHRWHPSGQGVDLLEIAIGWLCGDIIEGRIPNAASSLHRVELGAPSCCFVILALASAVRCGNESWRLSPAGHFALD